MKTLIRNQKVNLMLNSLEMNLSQASAKKAFAADIIQPYLT